MIEQTYFLDMIPGESTPPVVHVSQFDVNSRTLTFNLMKGGVAYEPDAGMSVTLDGTKPDNTAFSYPMTVNGSSVSINVQTQMTVVSGHVKCEVSVSNVSGKIGSANFILAVEEAAIDDDAISETDIPIFEDLKNQAQQAAASAEQSASDAEDFATDAETAASSVSSIVPASAGTTGQVLTKTATGADWKTPTGGQWGSITGNLSDQTDLNNALTELNSNLTSLAGSLAMIETSPATANHAVGDLIVFNNQLYKVTVAIASGESLTVGTNIASTSVGKELNNNCKTSESLTSLGNNKYNMSFNIHNPGFYVATCNCRCYGGGTYPEIISIYKSPDCSGDAVGGGVTTKEYGFVSFPMYAYFERGTHYLSFHNNVASDYFNARVALFRIGNK